MGLIMLAARPFFTAIDVSESFPHLEIPSKAVTKAASTTRGRVISKLWDIYLVRVFSARPVVTERPRVPRPDKKDPGVKAKVEEKKEKLEAWFKMVKEEKLLEDPQLVCHLCVPENCRVVPALNSVVCVHVYAVPIHARPGAPAGCHGSVSGCTSGRIMYLVV